jgi:hypothetical protein
VSHRYPCAERGDAAFTRLTLEGPLGVKLGSGKPFAECPLYPDERASSTAPTVPFRAMKRLLPCSKQLCHSMTLSARASNAGGTVTPSALAVLRFITSSNLVGCSTGMSATLRPRKSMAACRIVISGI